MEGRKKRRKEGRKEGTKERRKEGRKEGRKKGRAMEDTLILKYDFGLLVDYLNTHYKSNFYL
jgi:flagellar biosynthesis/type III secretory pathway protein FliH